MKTDKGREGDIARKGSERRERDNEKGSEKGTENHMDEGRDYMV